jgi:uncharacterized membrane protein
MSEQNPYQAPTAKVEVPLETGQLGEPRGVPAGRGFSWFGEGFDLFKRNPWIWILNVIIFFVILMLLGLIPIVSLVSNLLGPVFIGGFMLGCRAMDEGNELEVSHVFAGFQKNTGKLVGLGALNLLLTILLVVITFAVMFGVAGMDMTSLETGAAANDPQMGMGLLLTILVMTLLFIPLIMLFWFAPVILVLHDEVGIIDAMKLSFRGCLKNILPFLLYGILGFVLSIIATIPLGLGWLVLMPVVIAANYASYKDIYLGEADAG